MSVIAIDLRVFKAVANNLHAQAMATMKSKEHCLSVKHYVGAANVDKFMIELYRLNEYTASHRTEDAIKAEPITYTWWKSDTVTEEVFRNMQAPRIGMMQTVKFLQCIDYNIDEWVISQADTTPGAYFSKGIKQLRGLILALLEHIVSGMPEYDAARWCDLS